VFSSVGMKNRSVLKESVVQYRKKTVLNTILCACIGVNQYSQENSVALTF